MNPTFESLFNPEQLDLINRVVSTSKANPDIFDAEFDYDRHFDNLYDVLFPVPSKDVFEAHQTVDAFLGGHGITMGLVHFDLLDDFIHGILRIPELKNYYGIDVDALTFLAESNMCAFVVLPIAKAMKNSGAKFP